MVFLRTSISWLQGQMVSFFLIFISYTQSPQQEINKAYQIGVEKKLHGSSEMSSSTTNTANSLVTYIKNKGEHKLTQHCKLATGQHPSQRSTPRYSVPASKIWGTVTKKSQLKENKKVHSGNIHLNNWTPIFPGHQEIWIYSWIAQYLTMDSMIKEHNYKCHRYFPTVYNTWRRKSNHNKNKGKQNYKKRKEFKCCKDV